MQPRTLAISLNVYVYDISEILQGMDRTDWLLVDVYDNWKNQKTGSEIQMKWKLHHMIGSLSIIINYMENDDDAND